MTEMQKLKKVTGEKDEALLLVLLGDAEEQALAVTNRTKVIPRMLKPIRDLAVIAYNRMGTEGEVKRSEAGESYEFDALPKSIYNVLKGCRLGRCGGHAHEAEQKE